MSIEKLLTVGSNGAVDEVEVDVKAEHPSAHCRRCVLGSENICLVIVLKQFAP